MTLHTVGQLAKLWGVSPRAAYHTLQQAGLLGKCERPNARLLLVPERVRKLAERWREEHGRKGQLDQTTQQRGRDDHGTPEAPDHSG